MRETGSKRTGMVDRVEVAGRGLRVVSKSHRKLDGEAIVKGEARYTADMLPTGTLYGKILRSPHAHARIKRIDARNALAVPGVSLVLTHENVPRIAYTTAG